MGKAGPAPHLLQHLRRVGLVAWIQVSQHQVRESWFCPLLAATLVELGRVVMESLPWVQESRRANQLRYLPGSLTFSALSWPTPISTPSVNLRSSRGGRSYRSKATDLHDTG